MIYDADRGRLRGTLEHLGVLGQLVAGVPVEAELAGHLHDLRADGAVVGDAWRPICRTWWPSSASRSCSSSSRRARRPGRCGPRWPCAGARRG
jgi:hypothetical protein